ncbi:hypothetical protein [Acidisoma silvae]|uniref:Uncharacterized protein n=1 Tax=Acidisoma silvae TaxID=2802396 RepID=A0A963YXT1_9PROT|nr:hypothetical protein [Acidisoma silvae]MCB8878322.1 hypothetical protein [Acidisoma silvae]
MTDLQTSEEDAPVQLPLEVDQFIPRIGDEEWIALTALNTLADNQHFICATGVSEEAISNLIKLGFALGEPHMAQISKWGREAFTIIIKQDK